MVFKKSRQKVGPSTNMKYTKGRELGPFDVKCPKVQMGKAVNTREGGVAKVNKRMSY